MTIRTNLFPTLEKETSNFSPEHFSEEEKLIKQTVSQFVENKVIPNLENLEAYKYDYSRDLFKEAGQLGLLGAEVPMVYGGMEMSKKVSGIIAEGLGFGSSFGVSFNIHTGVGVLPYVYFGTEEQKNKYIPKLVSGEWIGAYALTEPNAGSDALAANASAKENEDGSFTLNGEKQWITNGHLAHVYVVFAKTKEGMTSFIVERDYPGVSVGLEEHKMGIRGSSTATLILEDVNVPKENMLGEKGKGHYIALNILNLARLKLAFSNIGSAKQAFNTGLSYAKERKQFKKSLVEFPLIQEKLANMAMAIYKAETSSYFTASLVDHQSIDETNILNILPDYAADCALNKVEASEALDYVVDEAVQIHGGYGYMEEYPIERMYRDARINRIFEGTNEINRLTVTRSFLKLVQKNREIISNNSSFEHATYKLSQQTLNIVLKALSSEEKIKLKDLEDEQELMRLLADLVKEIYVLQAILVRSKDSEKELVKQMTHVISEESLTEIQALAESICLRLVDEADSYLSAINETRIKSDLIDSKRKLAAYFINSGSYQV